MGYMEKGVGLGAVAELGFLGPIGRRINPANIHKKKHEQQRAKFAEDVAIQTAAARRHQIDLLSQAEAAAAEQANLTLRAAAERKAADLADNPLKDADVQLAEKPTETATATRAKKRKQFGFDTSGYSPGAKL